MLWQARTGATPLTGVSVQVPELAGFWLLTILLQFPLQAFLTLNTDLVRHFVLRCSLALVQGVGPPGDRRQLADADPPASGARHRLPRPQADHTTPS